MLEVIKDRPPNYAKILKRFPLVANLPGVMFCYGDAVYTHLEVSPSIMAHEEVHAARQRGFDRDPEMWWDQYLGDDLFRYEEELLAHKAEHQYTLANGNRRERRTALPLIAGRLASPLYQFPITKSQAKTFILAGT